MPYDTSNSFAINFIIRRKGKGVSVTSPELPHLTFTAPSTAVALKEVDFEIRKALDALMMSWQPLPDIQPPKERYRRWVPHTPLALKIFLYQAVQALGPELRGEWLRDSSSALRPRLGQNLKRSMISTFHPYHTHLVIEQLEKLGHPVVALTTKP